MVRIEPTAAMSGAVGGPMYVTVDSGEVVFDLTAFQQQAVMSTSMLTAMT